MGDRCSLCGRWVLGLAGHDWCVLPWMLAPGSDARPGPCHVRCLHERGVAAAWSGAVEAYHRKRWPRWLAGRDAGVRWRLHSSPPARTFHLWRADGRLASFPYPALRRTPPTLTAQLAEVGGANAAALLAAMAGPRVPLARLIAALHLTDRYPGVTGSVARRSRPGSFDVLIAHYPVDLDPLCRRAAHDLMRS